MNTRLAKIGYISNTLCSFYSVSVNNSTVVLLMPKGRNLLEEFRGLLTPPSFSLSKTRLQCSYQEVLIETLNHEHILINYLLDVGGKDNSLPPFISFIELVKSK